MVKILLICLISFKFKIIKIMRKFKCFFVFILFNYIGAKGQDTSKPPIVSNDAKISFDLVDITIDVEENDNQLHLQAFKSKSNDEIIDRNKINEFSRLKWVSIGNPRFIKTSNVNQKNVSQIFHFNDEGFYAFVEMLTKKQKNLFSNAIKRKYGTNVSSDQIVNLVLSKFECTLPMRDGAQTILIKGEVDEFYSIPLRLMFAAPLGSTERQLFQKLLYSNQQEENSDLIFKCAIEAGSVEKKENTLKISFDQINQLNLLDKLFGPASTTYVTRDQMSELAVEMYTSLNIIEEYEMPMYQFNEKFVEGLIGQVSASSFNQVSFDEAIQELSKYATNFDSDLKADVIKEDLGKIYELKKVKDKKFIKADKEHLNKLRTKYNKKGSGSVKGSASFLGLIKGSASASLSGEVDEEYDSLNSGKTLDEQLNELNTENINDIQWKIEGDRVVPKSIFVAKLNKASFSRSLIFNRIRKQSYDALFQRKITLPTMKFSSRPIINKFPIGTVFSVTSLNVLEYFDINGKGFGDYLGWYLADGKNGRPDLRGRYLVGYDPNENDYSKIGNTGGSNHVALAVGQLPEHTHSDTGHSHSISLTSSTNGYHSHNYKDIFYSERWGGFHDLEYNIPSNIGQGAKSDHDNWGLQMTRGTYGEGNHAHTISGNTETITASITKTGNNEKHENRPPYYVVAYIIFLDTN